MRVSSSKSLSELLKEPDANSIQPQLWVDQGLVAVACYEAALGATVLHQVGERQDVVAQLAVGEATLWVATSDSNAGRFLPLAIGGTTGRALLVLEGPDATTDRVLDAGAEEKSPTDDEHRWRVGRFLDPLRSRVGGRQAPRELAAALTQLLSEAER